MMKNEYNYDLKFVEEDIVSDKSHLLDFQLRLIDEITALDNKLCKLRPIICSNKNTVTMSVYEAVELKKQYDAMCDYYFALFNRCRIHGIININHCGNECNYEGK